MNNNLSKQEQEIGTANPSSSIKALLTTYLKGMSMGAADIVPGVSGGTIALITGIYERLITALSQIRPQLLSIFWKSYQHHGFRQAVATVWQKVDAWFLISLLSGIATSFILLAGVIKYLLDNQPLFIWSFFFGLVFATVLVLLSEIKHWRSKTVAFFILGLVSAIGVSLAPVMSSTPSLPFLFISGALAICAMILPGVSGSFILLLLGVYDIILQAVHDVNIVVLATVLAGMVTGLLSFTRLLKWLLTTHHQATLAVLIGFIAGSLVKVYPWKVADMGNVAPWHYPSGAHWAVTIGLMLLGAGSVFILSWLGQKHHH